MVSCIMSEPVPLTYVFVHSCHYLNRVAAKPLSGCDTEAGGRTGDSVLGASVAHAGDAETTTEAIREVGSWPQLPPQRFLQSTLHSVVITASLTSET